MNAYPIWNGTRSTQDSHPHRLATPASVAAAHCGATTGQSRAAAVREHDHRTPAAAHGEASPSAGWLIIEVFAMPVILLLATLFVGLEFGWGAAIVTAAFASLALVVTPVVAAGAMRVHDAADPGVPAMTDPNLTDYPGDGQ